MTDEELQEFRDKLEDLEAEAYGLVPAEITKVLGLIDELRGHRELIRSLERMEHKIFGAVGRFLPTRVVDFLYKSFDDLAKALFKMSGQPEPPPAQHILWGTQVLCDQRERRVWDRHEGQTYWLIGSIVLDGKSIDEHSFNEYKACGPCPGCAERLPVVVQGMNEFMAKYALGVSIAMGLRKEDGTLNE